MDSSVTNYSDEDRARLAMRIGPVMLGPVESVPCDWHEGYMVKLRWRWVNSIDLARLSILECCRRCVEEASDRG